VQYTPVWEPLADALKRVVEAGMGEDDAKIDLCRRMHDGAIAVRVWIDRDRAFSGGNVIVPRLDPIQLDWTRSRPLERWYIGPMTGQHYEGMGKKNRSIYLS
jgi:hypothetical protein